MSTGLSLGGRNGTEIKVFNFDGGGWITKVSPVKIPSPKTITALMIVLLLVAMNTST